MCISLYIYTCVSGGREKLNRRKAEFAQRLKCVDLTSIKRRGEIYENPSISKFLSHDSHLRAIIIAISPPGMFFLKTTIYTSTLYCTQVSGQIPLRSSLTIYWTKPFSIANTFSPLLYFSQHLTLPKTHYIFMFTCLLSISLMTKTLSYLLLYPHFLAHNRSLISM